MSQDMTMLSALLLEDDTSSESDTVSATTTSVVQVVATPKPSSRMFNGSRSRRRHEILSLREQVIALQEIIAAHTASDAAPCELEDKIQRAKQWQAVAQNQREKRRVSEAERDRLRRSVKQQRHLIRSVARIIGKQRALRAALREDSSCALRSKIVQLKTGNEFEDIASHLPSMILQLNGLFMDPRLASHTGQLRDVRVMNENTSAMTVETLNSRIVPFDVAATARAVWQFGLVKAQRVTNWMEEQAEESDNSMRRTFEASFNFPSFQGKADGRIAAWRIVESDRVVILQCGILNNASIQKSAGKFGVRLFNWTVIGPPRNEKLRGRAHDTCQIDTFEVSVPNVSGSEVVDTVGMSDVMKSLCIEAAEYVADIEREGVENLLLQGPLRS